MRDFVRLCVCAGAAVVAVAATGCRDDFQVAPREALAGTWELDEIHGMGTCNVHAGDLEILQAEDGLMDGEFWWQGECTQGGMLVENAVVVDVVIDAVDKQYQIDLDWEEWEAQEWDCVVDEPDLDCVELRGEEVLLYSFVRRSR